MYKYWLAALAVCVIGAIGTPCQAVDFRRGDANADGEVEIGDSYFMLMNLFRGGPAPPCEAAADFDGMNGFGFTDSLNLLQWLFAGGLVPPDPGPTSCGPDPGDTVPCLVYLAGCPVAEPPPVDERVEFSIESPDGDVFEGPSGNTVNFDVFVELRHGDQTPQTRPSTNLGFQSICLCR